MKKNKQHWTEESQKDFLFCIAYDFVSQIEVYMKASGISQVELAKRAGYGESRLSQILNNPGNVTLMTVVRLARAIGVKASVVAYDDGDPENRKGPLNSLVFLKCWEHCNKPRDMFDIQALADTADTPTKNLLRYRESFEKMLMHRSAGFAEVSTGNRKTMAEDMKIVLNLGGKNSKKISQTSKEENFVGTT